MINNNIILTLLIVRMIDRFCIYYITSVYVNCLYNCCTGILIDLYVKKGGRVGICNLDFYCNLSRRKYYLVRVWLYGNTRYV